MATPCVHAAAPVPMAVLTDEEMAARVARKEMLLRQQSRAQPGLDMAIRSDINPEAAATLRSRSMTDNARASLAKQAELQSRDKLRKRDDLCEMLGRGC